jgi:hypothetical protein
MIPVMQLNRHDPKNGVIGDCFRACICSLLEIEDIWNVPNFVKDPEWPNQLYEYLKSRGYTLWWSERHKPPKHVEYYIVQGVSPRGVNHSVIFKDGKMVHDPHPDGGGIQEPYTAYLWLEPDEEAGGEDN